MKNVIPRPKWKERLAEIRNDGPAEDERYLEVEEDAYRLLRREGLNDWDIVQTSGRAHLGRCDASKRHLRLSLPFIIVHRGRDLSHELGALVTDAAKIEGRASENTEEFTDEMRRIAPLARKAVSLTLGEGWRFEFSSERRDFASMVEPERKRIRIFTEWAREQSLEDLSLVVKDSITDARKQRRIAL